MYYLFKERFRLWNEVFLIPQNALFLEGAVQSSSQTTGLFPLLHGFKRSFEEHQSLFNPDE
jgi:hypothetical protein